MNAQGKLVAWLDKINARCLWQLDKKDFWIEAHVTNGRVFLVQIFKHEGKPSGWDIYTSIPSGSNKIDDALEDAEKRLGLR